MMVLVFSGLTLGFVFMAAFVTPIRYAILALWVAGLGVGAIYLTIGAELLAIIQWIISTLITISFVFFSVMFGEYNDRVESVQTQSKKISGNFLLTFLSGLMGVGFTLIIWQGTKDLPMGIPDSLPQLVDLSMMGRLLTQENLLSLEVLALILFLVLLGGGVVARFEGEEES